MRRALTILLVVLLVVLLAAIMVPIIMRLAVSPYIFTTIDTAPTSEVAIVLGASVYEGKPSPILAARADAAIRLYNAGKVSKILVTGDNGALTHDEVTPVRRYLLDSGVRPDDIFLDHAGFDTYSSMYRAKAVFGATSAIIATQDFHLPRALFIARALGITAYGFVADGEGNWRDYAREVPASDKALTDLFIGRMPTFLGQPYPLTGAGEATWY